MSTFDTTGDHAAQRDSNRDLVVKALRFLVERADSADDKAAKILMDYTIQSAIFNYDTLPEHVCSQIVFRDQLPSRVNAAARDLNELRTFADGHAFDDFGPGKGLGKSTKFIGLLDKARAAIRSIHVPEVDSGEIEFVLAGGDPDASYVEDLDDGQDDDVVGRA